MIKLFRMWNQEIIGLTTQAGKVLMTKKNSKYYVIYMYSCYVIIMTTSKIPRIIVKAAL